MSRMHDELVKRAKSAVHKVYADRTVNLETNQDSLLEIKDLVEGCLETVTEDLNNRLKS